jgi:hypothetical protein
MATVSFSAAPADPTQLGSTDATGGDPASPQVDLPVAEATQPTTQDRPGRQPVELSETQIAFARAAAGHDAEAAGRVGEYLGATAEDDVAVSAAFASADRGYRGWYWSVTLAVIDPAQPTVSEVVLLPGEEALLAPAWVPWDQRIRAGDVAAGDLLPTPADDVRLVPSYVDSADPALAELAYEFGFGRTRVLSREGRDEAAQRWHDNFGPDSPIAVAAQAHCVTCGFYLPLAGLLGQALGACGNEFSPADGRVVDADFGCGAHSDTVIDAPLISASTETVIDELTLEVHDRPAPAGAEWDAQVQDAVTEDGMVEALTDVAEGNAAAVELADLDLADLDRANGDSVEADGGRDIASSDDVTGSEDLASTDDTANTVEAAGAELDIEQTVSNIDAAIDAAADAAMVADAAVDADVIDAYAIAPAGTDADAVPDAAVDPADVLAAADAHTSGDPASTDAAN